jgi:hypothetical protein
VDVLECGGEVLVLAKFARCEYLYYSILTEIKVRYLFGANEKGREWEKIATYRSIRYRLRTPTTSISRTFVTGGFFSLDSLSCLSPSAFVSMKPLDPENAGILPK